MEKAKQSQEETKEDVVIVLEPVVLNLSLALDQRKRKPKPGVNPQTRGGVIACSRTGIPPKRKTYYRVSTTFVWAMFEDLDEKYAELIRKQTNQEILSLISEPEYFAINALLMIIEDHRDQLKQIIAFSNELRHTVTYVILEMPEKEFYRAFFEAYGLKRTKKGYDKESKQIALEALRELDRKKFLVTVNFIVEESKKRRIEKKYIEHVRLVEFVREGVDAVIEEEKRKETKKITLRLHWVLTHGLDNFYTLRRRDKLEIISNYAKSRREAFEVLRLTDYLETFDISPVKLGLERLSGIIKCKSLYTERKRKRLLEKIRRVLEIAQKAGWVDGWEEQGDYFVIVLNPEMCRRVKPDHPGVQAQKPGGTCAVPGAEIGLGTAIENGTGVANKIINKKI